MSVEWYETAAATGPLTSGGLSRLVSGFRSADASISVLAITGARPFGAVRRLSPLRGIRLRSAVAMGLTDTNPTARIRNTRAAVRREQRPFESWDQVEAVSAEIDPRYAAIPVVLAGTGLRPEELFALERRDVDLDAGVLSVERVYTQRILKDPEQVQSPAPPRSAARARPRGTEDTATEA